MLDSLLINSRSHRRTRYELSSPDNPQLVILAFSSHTFCADTVTSFIRAAFNVILNICGDELGA